MILKRWTLSFACGCIVTLIFIFFSTIMHIANDNTIRPFNSLSDQSYKNVYLTYDSRTLIDMAQPHWKFNLIKQAKNPPILIRGLENNPMKKQFSIGISTVYRPANYIVQTLYSLINESTTEEKGNCTIIIYLADTDLDAKETQLSLITKHFNDYIKSGFIQIISATPDIYPPMDFALTHRTFNDSIDRVIWRTKQVIDFTFLFLYLKNYSEYHLILEDDNIATPHYFQGIRTYITYKSNVFKWISLEFTGFDIIGRLFRTKDLEELAEFLLLFHKEWPVDLLIEKYISMKLPNNKIPVKRIPSLFQHIGTNSSLPNKVQKLVDKSFNNALRLFKHKNPKVGAFSTTLTPFRDCIPENAYNEVPGYFWGIPKQLQVGEISHKFDIIYDTMINVSRIVIITGIGPRNKDVVVDGDLKISKNCTKTKDGFMFADFETVGSFSNLKTKGALDVKLPNYLKEIKCIRIELPQKLSTWVIIKEIQVFSE